uniref:Uncharacterized protein n=1 Tax=Eutreptiella gymnastica TaxID=73025 RepID=A0A7S1NLE6_9EUGL|mmetsp:Transcript_56826/g.101389  ORF Transcript_56826/g.101389 Transcript_56826/m.101389 type:complete len:415 (+) Transcript_56826:165-1409(+)
MQAFLNSDVLVPEHGLFEPPDLDHDLANDSGWRYSRFAMPCIFMSFVASIVVLALTVCQQVGTFKHFVDGVPRVIQLQDYVQVGLPTYLWLLRVAGFCCGITGVISAIAVFFLRPFHPCRDGLSLIGGASLMIAALLGWVSFVFQLTKLQSLQECPSLRRFTGETCEDRTRWAVAAATTDAVVGVMGVVSSVLVVHNTRAHHWMISPRGWEETLDHAEAARDRKVRAPGNYGQDHVSAVRKQMTGLALCGVAAALPVWMSLTAVLIGFHQTETVLGPRGISDSMGAPLSVLPFEESGWPIANTCLRYAASSGGVVTVLLNLLPSRSPWVARAFAVLYIVVAVLCFIVFGWDVAALGAVQDPCPVPPDGASVVCSQAPYIVTCVTEFLTGILMLGYVALEYGWMQRFMVRLEYGP